MRIANKYEVPDKCPENCCFKEDGNFQGSTCSRCPVFNCTYNIIDDPEYKWAEGRLLEPEEYREDWAEEWEKFFKDGTIPNLYLFRDR